LFRRSDMGPNHLSHCDFTLESRRKAQPLLPGNPVFPRPSLPGIRKPLSRPSIARLVLRAQ
jgi:hypothetical protein